MFFNVFIQSDFIGIELDKKYFEIAKQRINEAAMLNSIAYKSTVGG